MRHHLFNILMVFSLIFLHYTSDLSHNSEICHPLTYAHAEGTPSGALPEQPSRDASLYLPRKDDGERVSLNPQ